MGGENYGKKSEKVDIRKFQCIECLRNLLTKKETSAV